MLFREPLLELLVRCSARTVSVVPHTSVGSPMRSVVNGLELAFMSLGCSIKDRFCGT